MTDPAQMADTLRDALSVMAAIERARIHVATEDWAQTSIARALARAGIEAEREVALDGASRIDFLAGVVGVEVKVKGQRRAIWRQLDRYAAHPRIGALVLATGVAMPISGWVNGKPLLVASLSRGWL